MRANQRMVATDGYEVMLFPLEYMYISQGEYGTLSHNLAMDFLGWGGMGQNDRIYNCPYYAPCSCRCVANWGSDNATWESLNPVHCADGVLRTVTFCFNHDANPPSVGTVINQGDLIGHTGTAGVATGDHVHINTAIGTYQGYSQLPGLPYYELTNSTHIYDICYVNDTGLVRDYGYNWRDYQGGIEPSPTDIKKKKFPWFLYARKLRNERSLL